MENKIIELKTNINDTEDINSNLTICEVSEDNSQLIKADQQFNDFLFYAGQMMYKNLKIKAA